MLFVEPEPVEAVLAVLEMVLAIVWLPNENVQALGFGTTVALPATSLRVGATSRRRGSPAWGVRALAPRRRCAEALASRCSLQVFAWQASDT